MGRYGKYIFGLACLVVGHYSTSVIETFNMFNSIQPTYTDSSEMSELENDVDSEFSDVEAHGFEISVNDVVVMQKNEDYSFSGEWNGSRYQARICIDGESGGKRDGKLSLRKIE